MPNWPRDSELFLLLHGLEPTRLFCSPAFPGKNTWSGLPFPPPGDLFDAGTAPTSPVLAGGFFTNATPGKPVSIHKDINEAHTTTESSIYMSTSWVLQLRCRDSKGSAEDHRAAKKRNQDQNSAVTPFFFFLKTHCFPTFRIWGFIMFSPTVWKLETHTRASESEATH